MYLYDIGIVSDAYFCLFLANYMSLSSVLDRVFLLILILLHLYSLCNSENSNVLNNNTKLLCAYKIWNLSAN